MPNAHQLIWFATQENKATEMPENILSFYPNAGLNIVDIGTSINLAAELKLIHVRIYLCASTLLAVCRVGVLSTRICLAYRTFAMQRFDTLNRYNEGDDKTHDDSCCMHLYSQLI